MSHVARLRTRLAERTTRGIVSMPGCWDALTALLVERAGFEAGFVSGAGLSMAMLGRADLGLVPADRVVDTIALMRDATELPLLADGDTGFGNALTLQRFVRMLERAGASAVQIEDQTFPKRCGHMPGKQVVALDQAVGRVRAALDARGEMLVVARTDALGVEGLPSAMERAEAFLAEGADAVFIEGPRTMAELAQVAQLFAGRVPLVHNLAAGGISPTDDEAVLEELGVAVALHPLLLMGGLATCGPRWLAGLAEARSSRRLRAETGELHDLNELTGAKALLDQGALYGC
ncbi:MULTISPECIES: oxaloacetate decarboxylase [unclassified Novosphingobium]|uniref:isocitrate lyase/PEP mutase family protein n=1 Tax=unclassified Novosphingobium TaxID=2644732 RepID=UPI00135A136D|nr:MULTISPECIES: isocitrate lyase/PEP mutase family protein [unclassified Novosphingobium]